MEQFGSKQQRGLRDCVSDAVKDENSRCSGPLRVAVEAIMVRAASVSGAECALHEPPSVLPSLRLSRRKTAEEQHGNLIVGQLHRWFRSGRVNKPSCLHRARGSMSSAALRNSPLRSIILFERPEEAGPWLAEESSSTRFLNQLVDARGSPSTAAAASKLVA